MSIFYPVTLFVELSEYWMICIVCFAEVMKGYDYQKLKSSVTNDQTNLGKTKEEVGEGFVQIKP